MKKHILHILGLAIIIGIIPSLTHCIDAVKNGLTVRVTYDKDKSDMLKQHNLACLHVRIKNSTNTPVEISRNAVCAPFTADEKALTTVMGSMKKEIVSDITEFIMNTGQLSILMGISIFSINKFVTLDPSSPHYGQGLDFITILKASTLIPLAITTSKTIFEMRPATMIYRYHRQTAINAMLQKYLDRKTITIQVSGEVGLYVFIDLDQYQDSISKNIIARVHKKDNDQILVYEVDTTGLLPAEEVDAAKTKTA